MMTIEEARAVIARKEKLTALFNILETVPENSPEYEKADQELDHLLFDD